MSDAELCPRCGQRPSKSNGCKEDPPRCRQRPDRNIHEDMTLGHLGMLLARWEVDLHVIQHAGRWEASLTHVNGRVDVSGSEPGTLIVEVLRRYRDKVRKGVP